MKLSIAIVVAALGFIVGWFSLGILVKRSLTQNLTTALKADVHFDSVSIQLGSGKIIAHGGILHSLDPAAPWTEARFDQATCDFPFEVLFTRTAPATVFIDGARLHLRAPSGTSPSPSPQLPSAWPLDLQGIVIRQLEVSSEAGAYPVHLQGVDISAGKGGPQLWHGSFGIADYTVGPLTAHKAGGNFTQTSAGLSVELSLQFGEGGAAGATATIANDKPDDASITFWTYAVPLQFLISERWQIFAQSSLNAQGHYLGPIYDWTKGEAHAAVVLNKAQLLSPPFLKNLSLVPGLGDLGDLSVLKFDEAGALVGYKRGTFTFSTLKLKSRTLNIYGTATLGSADLNLDATLYLGLPQKIVMLVPPLEGTIFVGHYENFDWAQVKVSGQPGQWQEDLSPRLLDLAKAQGGLLLHQSLDKANDFLNSLTKPQ